ncbi:hypothetical protein [Erythrobacter aureus]|uniref:hypothetical protein n=1 Tax=Erythrobacter aureus TaxID=2182384 RepID=UPI003A8E7310
MTKTRHLIASAPIAIAAMAALHALPAHAQEAPPANAQDAPILALETLPQASSPAPAPVAIASQPPAAASATTPTATAPVLPVEPVAAEPVLPETQPVQIEQAEPVEPVSADPAPVRPATNARETYARESTPASEPAAVISVSENEGVAASAMPVTDNTMETPIVAESELAPIPEPIRDESSAALLFALLGIGGIGLVVAFLLMRRRRRTTDVPTIERPVVAAPMTIDREPVVTALDEAPHRELPVDPAPTQPTSDVAVPLPVQLPESRRERGRLLRSLIEARPDRANPFRSYKARAKRARLILQSIGTRFTNRKPGIDLSQYTNVWPELRGWRPAAA